MSTALLLVDLQEEFLGREGLLPGRSSIIDRTESLLNEFRSRSWPVFHLRTTVKRSPDQRLPHWKKANVWPCLEGSAGHAAPEALAEENNETVLHKQGFTADGLVDSLSEDAIETVVVCGVMTHACVRQAVTALYEAGFHVLVVEDAVGSDDPVHAASTIRFFEQRSIDFLSADELPPLIRENTVAKMDAATLSSAVAKATKAFPSWKSTPYRERAALAKRLSARLLDEQESLARLMAEELGKPIRLGRSEVVQTTEMIEAVIRRLSKVDTPIIERDFEVKRSPHGVVGIITPWNHPVYIALGKIIPAILCGNTVVWKPSPKSQKVNRFIQAIIRELRWPDGLLTMVEGGSRISRELMAAPGMDALTITSSQLPGYHAAENCARRHLPFQAELGGNNAAIVWHDADLATAAELIAKGAFLYGGQRCTANRRVIIESSIKEEFLRLLEGAISGLAWGDPGNSGTDIGPLPDEGDWQRIDACVANAIQDGCEMRRPLGGKPKQRLDQNRYWYPPTLLLTDDPDIEIVQEETFGPVLVVQTADNWDEAVSLTNGVRQGLAAALFSESDERISRFLTEAKAGILKINDSTASVSLDSPFGGWKSSGTGPPEHGDFDIEFYTRVQTVYRN